MAAREGIEPSTGWLTVTCYCHWATGHYWIFSIFKRCSIKIALSKLLPSIASNNAFFKSYICSALEISERFSLALLLGIESGLYFSYALAAYWILAKVVLLMGVIKIFIGGMDGTRTRTHLRDRQVLWPIKLPPQNLAGIGRTLTCNSLRYAVARHNFKPSALNTRALYSDRLLVPASLYKIKELLDISHAYQFVDITTGKAENSSVLNKVVLLWQLLKLARTERIELP